MLIPVPRRYPHHTSRLESCTTCMCFEQMVFKYVYLLASSLPAKSYFDAFRSPKTSGLKNKNSVKHK